MVNCDFVAIGDTVTDTGGMGSAVAEILAVKDKKVENIAPDICIIFITLL